MTAKNRRNCPPVPEAERFYLIGICGTGMGNLALMLRDAGYGVLGSDTGFYEPMSAILGKAGIEMRDGWRAENLDDLDPAKDIVIVGNVCRRDNPEAVRAVERSFCCLSLPECLREFFLMRCKNRAVITGTHGKTTTSSLTASILHHARRDPSFFIGGEILGLGRGARIGNANGDDATFVIEGDEYDTAYFDKVPKFWHYEGSHVVVNNIEYDHADIYANIEEIRDVFRKLLHDLPKGSHIFLPAGDETVEKLCEDVEAETHRFGFGESAEYRIEDCVYTQAGTNFKLVMPHGRCLNIESPLIGEFNARNVAAAAALCDTLGVRSEDIQEAVSRFSGVRKRQELIGEARGIRIYDDFAHHPTAVRETVRAIAEKEKGKKLWGVFEIKSNTSRRAVFQKDYAEALSACDAVILSAPWKKDNLPPEMLIDIPLLAEMIRERGCEAVLIEKIDDIVNYLSENSRAGDVILGMSGSNFGQLHHKLLRRLSAP